MNLYQIHWKYRDELRPRFGMLRAREFLMKDAYSFDRDLAGCQASYDAMYAAYEKVFTRCGLTFRSVKAQSGEIGGDASQEFMAVAAVGEDAFVWCEQCDYATNTEAATKQELAEKPAPDDAPAMEQVHTPDLPGIELVAKALKTKPNRLLKSIAFEVDGDLGLAIVPGNREVNEFALDAAVPRHRGEAPHRRRLRGTPGPAEGLHRARTSKARSTSSRTRPSRPAPLDHRRERDRPPRPAAACWAGTSPPPSGPRSRSSSPATRARSAGSRCASTAASRSVTSSSSARSTPKPSARSTTTKRAASTRW